MNNVTLIGNTAETIETRQAGNGETMAAFRMATNERWKDDQGDTKERATWHNVVAFGWVARAVNSLPKGSRIVVVGKITERSYTTNDGQTRYVHEVRAQVVALVCMDPTRTSE